MEEELRNLRKNYRKVKILFRKKINFEEARNLISLDRQELQQTLNLIKDNIILLPLIEPKIDLDFILKRIVEAGEFYEAWK